MKRIQRKRQKGFRLSENAKCVDRTTKWGNPYKVVEEDGLFHVVDPSGNYWGPHPYNNKEEAQEIAVQCYKGWVDGQIISGQLSVEELKGKDLACFCKLGTPCHADYLIEIIEQGFIVVS